MVGDTHADVSAFVVEYHVSVVCIVCAYVDCHRMSMLKFNVVTFHTRYESLYLPVASVLMWIKKSIRMFTCKVEDSSNQI